MKGRLIDLVRSLNGRWRITIEIDQDVRDLYGKLKDADVKVEIKKWRKPRSNDANAYMWILVDKLADALQTDKDVVYRQAIRSIGGVSDIVCVRDAAVPRLRESWAKNGTGWSTETMPSKIEGCTNVILYYGSSTYDTKQMSNLIDHLVQECKEQGIETLPPDELRRMGVI